MLSASAVKKLFVLERKHGGLVCARHDFLIREFFPVVGEGVDDNPIVAAAVPIIGSRVDHHTAPDVKLVF
jgi:hypothetical protein